MKNRLHGKQAGLTILAILIATSVADVIFRAVSLGAAVINAPNLGEQLVVITLAAFIMVMTGKGKDRICFIGYAAWLGYFIMDQLFELPGTIASFVNLVATQGGSNSIFITINSLASILRILSMMTIVAIGLLLAEYLNDKSIYNRAFNILCIATTVMISGNILIDICNLIALGYIPDVVLAIFNNIMRLAMVHLFAYFAYDSARVQLKNVTLSK